MGNADDQRPHHSSSPLRWKGPPLTRDERDLGRTWTLQSLPAVAAIFAKDLLRRSDGNEPWTCGPPAASMDQNPAPGSSRLSAKVVVPPPSLTPSHVRVPGAHVSGLVMPPVRVSPPSQACSSRRPPPLLPCASPVQGAASSRGSPARSGRNAARSREHPACRERSPACRRQNPAQSKWHPARSGQRPASTQRAGLSAQRGRGPEQRGRSLAQGGQSLAQERSPAQRGRSPAQSRGLGQARRRERARGSRGPRGGHREAPVLVPALYLQAASFPGTEDSSPSFHEHPWPWDTCAFSATMPAVRPRGPESQQSPNHRPRPPSVLPPPAARHSGVHGAPRSLAA